MRAVRSIAAGLVAATVLAGASAAAAPAADGRYVVEFRARSGGLFGHTYVAYGRVDRDGRLRDPRYAGFYPSGALTDTPFLAVLAAPSHVSLKPRDRNVRSDLVYRREISPQTYARFSSEIRNLRRERPLWHLTLYNCNSFAGDVAEWMGMRVPATIQLPKNFVRGLYELNRRSRAGTAYAAARGGTWQAPDVLFERMPGNESIDR